MRRTLLIIFALMISLTASQPSQAQPSGKLYQQMTATERAAFVSEKVRRIAFEISGSEYEFTPAFESDIQQALNRYAQRIGSNGKTDTRLVFQRGQANAPTLIAAFKAQNVSPLIGLYIPWIESAYVNIPNPNAMGSIGMFQFLPKTGARFGLSESDLLDVPKSADAAARYIIESTKTFAGDPMKEALALLSYNRGVKQTAKDLQLVINDQNKQCSICALSAERAKLDESFRSESVYYIPQFFAAAIIGENPQAFGLQGTPLSLQ